MSAAATMDSKTERRHDAYEKLLQRCRALEPVVTAVAYPCEETALTGPVEAAEARLIKPILVGPRQKIRDVAKSAGLTIDCYEIVDVPDSHAAAAKAVELVRSARAEILMKGSLHTDEFMGAIVASATGLRTGRRISHAFVMSVPTYSKALIITDSAINIAPTLDDKRDICQNAIDLAHSLGLELPKVAILSAVETVTTKIPSTIDAAALCKMADRGQITGALLDGPLAMDNAINLEAAHTKGIDSAVAGDADILIAPDLEAGNILAKQLTFLAKADAAGLVLGARVPIILTSRADSVRVRMASCGVALLVAHARRTGQAVGNAS
ncbi:MAG TPA: bifunctional enoyl-CoA hydratase/phosphate acetyltransferase [Phycisphaerae bacterium]|nr:bifunctional enoyl-CoA hydratase/phosphate acetyltransferase [Phycisphaerae bacterium]